MSKINLDVKDAIYLTVYRAIINDEMLAEPTTSIEVYQQAHDIIHREGNSLEDFRPIAQEISRL